MARSRVRHTAVKRPSMALTAFASFSALVAVSVGLSNGSAPAPWESAYANESSQNQADRGTFGQAQGEGQGQPSLFAAVPDQALISDVQNAPQNGFPQDPVARQVRNVSDRGTESAPSSVAPAKRAPATFDGQLPVNTLIAPAQPVTVLSGGEFGWRTAPDTKEHEFHNGADVSAPEGTPVVAALDGTVTAVFWDVWGGNRVEVSHANGMKTTYNHLKDVMVQVGDPLKASEQLGTVGQTGLRVTGPHLHFETWVEGKVVDPQSFDWETGEGIIPASRPKYSLEDQAPTDQATSGNGSAPGTDNGPASDVPKDEQDRIVALSQETSPAEHTPAETGAAAASGPAKPAPSRSSSHDDAATGRVTAGGSSGAAPSSGSGATSTKSGADKDAASKPAQAAKDKAAKDAAANKATKDAAAKQKAAKDKAAAVAAAQKKAAEDAEKQTAKDTKVPPAPATKPVETKDPKPVPSPSETGKPKPKPSPTTTPTGPEAPTAPEVPGVPAEPVTPPEAPKPGTPPKPETPPKDDKPAKPQVNPYTAPIAQLSTLEQIQQRTQSLVTQQLTLTPAEQFGPDSQLTAQLPLLSQQLVTAKLDQKDPKFTAQLTAAQAAVDKAAAAPKDKKLTEAATAQLTKLQTMLAEVPAYVDPAAPAG